MSDQDSKKQILRSTGVLGSVQIITILVGIIRVKALAVLLGPTGVGIAGVYQTTVTLIGSVTGLGLSFSGVRDIAAVATSGEKGLVAKTMVVLKRWSWFTGIVGMLIALIFSRLLSRIAFGNESYSTGIACLSIAVLLSALTGGLSATLQGMRRIGEMAKANVFGAIIGVSGSIAIYKIWGSKGIVAAVLFTFLSAQVATWYFARAIRVPKIRLSAAETYKTGLSMAKLGFFTVFASFSGNGIMYLVRSFIVQKGGLPSVGNFIASWTISSMYVSAIFSAMSADYYPRLSGVQNDNAALKKLVNEQTEVALLLTVPIIIAMLSFIGIVVKLLYSKDFGTTANILNWQLLGDFFKVLCWPMGFIFLAKARGGLFVLAELIWNLLFLAIIFFGWKLFGIQISGIAFLVAYAVYVILIFIAVRKLIDFKWSVGTLKHMAFFLPLLILAYLNTVFFVGEWKQYVIGSILTISAVLFSFYHLKKIVDLKATFSKFRNKLIPG